MTAPSSRKSHYRFTPEEIQSIANLHPELPLEQRWEAMRAELERRHPRRVAPKLHWTFNAAGNVVCNIAIVYAAPNEYVAFFGTPIGATGFSGRYPFSDVWDCMVAGTMYTYDPGQFNETVYHAGQTAFLKKGSRRVFRYVDSCWMIDYARGNILTMFPYGVIAPALFSTHDFKSAREEFCHYARLTIRSMFGW